MLLRKGLPGLNDLMEVCIHELKDQIQVIEGSSGSWQQSFNSDNILMLQVSQKLDFSQCPSCIHFTFKCPGVFLYGVSFFSHNVLSQAAQWQTGADKALHTSRVFYLKLQIGRTRRLHRPLVQLLSEASSAVVARTLFPQPARLPALSFRSMSLPRSFLRLSLHG